MCTCAQPKHRLPDKSSAKLPAVATLSCDWKPIISGFGAMLHFVCNIVQLQNFIHYSSDQDDFLGGAVGNNNSLTGEINPKSNPVVFGRVVRSSRRGLSPSAAVLVVTAPLITFKNPSLVPRGRGCRPWLCRRGSRSYHLQCNIAFLLFLAITHFLGGGLHLPTLLNNRKHLPVWCSFS